METDQAQSWSALGRALRADSVVLITILQRVFNEL